MARAVGLFLGLALIWGGSFPAITVGLEDYPPVLFAAVRYGIAAVVLFGYAVVATERWWPADRQDWLAIAAAGVFLVAGNGLLFIGQQHTTSGVAAIIFSLVPILTTAVAWGVLPEERHSRLGLVGVLVGLVGVAVIARPDPSNLLAPAVVGKGFVTLATVSVAIGSVAVQRAEPSLPDTTFTAWAMGVGAVLLQVGSVAAGERAAAVSLTREGVFALAYLAVLATAVAYVIYFVLLSAHGPLEVNLVTYLVPVVATVVGWALLDEPVTVGTIGGFALILVGFWLVKREALRGYLRRRRTSRQEA
jgi:drug/metabolite transporter (DMT)-like permease